MPLFRSMDPITTTSSHILPLVDSSSSPSSSSNNNYYPITQQQQQQSQIVLTQAESETVNQILNDQNKPPTSSATLPDFSMTNFSSSTSALLARPSAKSLLGTLQGSSQQQHHAVGCSHHNAGQELCYLCHQRQRRNVPVYLGEEQRQKEKEESQLLAQYQHLKV